MAEFWLEIGVSFVKELRCQYLNSLSVLMINLSLERCLFNLVGHSVTKGRLGA